MKTLLLLRHGKAVASDPAGDHARSLSDRGRAQAAEVAESMREPDLEPDVALVSDARRTQETAELALASSSRAAGWHADPDLYDASATDILSVIKAKGGDASRLVVVGHNPGMGDLARRLASDGDPKSLKELAKGFPTCALAVIDLPIETWEQVGSHKGTLRRLILPKS